MTLCRNPVCLMPSIYKFASALQYVINFLPFTYVGIDLGNYLIKTVVRELQSELPNLTQFSSLSPIPGFREWILTEINQELGGRQVHPLLDEARLGILASILKCEVSVA